MKFKAGFIGCGNMGGALSEAVAHSIGESNVTFYDTDIKKVKAFHDKTNILPSPSQTVYSESKFIFFGVKPNIIENVLREAADFTGKNSIIVSMAAGVSINTVAASVGADKKIIRIMPNTPAAIGAGTVLYSLNKNVTTDDETDFLNIMSKTGIVSKIDENLIDAAAALSGCGPAFVYIFIEALADGAVACGLPREKALLYAKQTVLGSAALALDSKKHMGELKDNVCSPGGTTIEGVLTLEKGSFRATAASAVIAAYEKTKKLK